MSTARPVNTRSRRDRTGGLRPCESPCQPSADWLSTPSEASGSCSGPALGYLAIRSEPTLPSLATRVDDLVGQAPAVPLCGLSELLILVAGDADLQRSAEIAVSPNASADADDGPPAVPACARPSPSPTEATARRRSWPVWCSAYAPSTRRLTARIGGAYADNSARYEAVATTATATRTRATVASDRPLAGSTPVTGCPQALQGCRPPSASRRERGSRPSSPSCCRSTGG